MRCIQVISIIDGISHQGKSRIFLYGQALFGYNMPASNGIEVK